MTQKVKGSGDVAKAIRTRLRKAPEKRIQWKSVKLLRDLGFFVVSTSQPQRAMMTAGIPDLFCAHRRFGQFWVEVKNPTRRNHARGGLTIDQLQWHMAAKECGVEVITVYDESDLLPLLKAKGAIR